MHIPDGFLSPHVTLPSAAVSLPLWWYALRQYSKRDPVESLPVIGSLTAFAFIVQTIMIPVPGGTSAHVAGCGLIAVLYGPWVSFLCETLVLAIQAFLFGMGGVMSLPVNALAIGLVGPAAGVWLWKWLSPLNEKVALFASGYAAMGVSALVIAATLGIQHQISERYFPLPFSVVLPALMVSHLLFVGVLEGMYSMLTYAMLKRIHAIGTTP